MLGNDDYVPPLAYLTSKNIDKSLVQLKECSRVISLFGQGVPLPRNLFLLSVPGLVRQVILRRVGTRVGLVGGTWWAAQLFTGHVLRVESKQVG